MDDMRAVIIPKSDQLNSDDLIGGPRTITITEVSIRPGTEQPVSIHFDGDDKKPWKPCKSMSRVMVHMWGPDAKVYIGRRVTLKLDPEVKWGGMAVGGIRISHMSHIDRKMVMALTATKGQRKPFVVKPLDEAAAETVSDDLESAADSAAIFGMVAYEAFFKGSNKAGQKTLLSGHERRKETARQADASAALSKLRAATTESDLDAEWERLTIETCRELGAEALEECRAAIQAGGE
jgi:hypothetical protein